MNGRNICKMLGNQVQRQGAWNTIVTDLGRGQGERGNGNVQICITMATDNSVGKAWGGAGAGWRGTWEENRGHL